MNKYKSASLMRSRSLDSSKAPSNLSINYSKSELEKLAEGLSGNGNNYNTSKSPSTTEPQPLPVLRKKSIGIIRTKANKIPTIFQIKDLSRPHENISKGWGGSTHHFQLAVEQGNVFITNKFRPAPEFNSFEPTKDLGSPGATRRWVLHLEDFRDHEISFHLQRNKLTARGYQTTRKDSPKFFHQSISLPNPLCVDCLKVYRNKQLGTIIIALIPDSFPFFKYQ